MKFWGYLYVFYLCVYFVYFLNIDKVKWENSDEKYYYYKNLFYFKIRFYYLLYFRKT